MGSAALPITLTGQAHFQGQLNSSWLTPRIEGRLTATSIGVQISNASPNSAAPPQYLFWDSVDLDGLYTPASIAIHHGLLKRGAASLTVEGHIDADDPTYDLRRSDSQFNGNSALSLKVNAHRSITTAAAAGNNVLSTADAQVEVTVPLNAHPGLRQHYAVGTDGGSPRPVGGKIGFTVAGDGTMNDPRLQAKATLSKMTVGGEPVSDLLVSASSHERAVTYDISSHQPTGDFTAHGETKFDTDYTTQASLRFSKFDVGALLKLLKVTGITGQSNLEGMATISGPLAHPEKLGGDANLNQLAVVIDVAPRVAGGVCQPAWRICARFIRSKSRAKTPTSRFRVRLRSPGTRRSTSYRADQ